MALDPTLGKKILDSEDGKKFAKFIAETVLSLDTIRDIKVTDPTQIALEVRARTLAVEKLEEILSAMFVGRDSTMPGETSDDFKM